MHWLVRSSSFSKAQGLRETGSWSGRVIQRLACGDIVIRRFVQRTQPRVAATNKASTESLGRDDVNRRPVASPWAVVCNTVMSHTLLQSHRHVNIIV